MLKYIEIPTSIVNAVKPLFAQDRNAATCVEDACLALHCFLSEFELDLALNAWMFIDIHDNGVHIRGLSCVEPDGDTIPDAYKIGEHMIPYYEVNQILKEELDLFIPCDCQQIGQIDVPPSFNIPYHGSNIQVFIIRNGNLPLDESTPLNYLRSMSYRAILNAPRGPWSF